MEAPEYLRRLLACTTALVALTTAAKADDALVRTTFGGIGLIEMPSARMAPDGQLSMGASFTHNTQHYNFTFQALPWLEADFRYTGLEDFNIQYPVYYDRSFAMKARLWDEDGYFPAVAVGINDLVGTGIYSGEYLVASKRFGSVDATLGLGWGRLSTAGQIANPLGQIIHSFQTRPDGFNTAGGAHFNLFFHGPHAGIFGGLNWATPLDGLTLTAEYSSDRYVVETQLHTFRARDQFNFGASYQFSNGISLGVDWLYGESLGAHFAFQVDPVHDPFPQRIGPAPPEPRVRSAEERQEAINTLLDLRKGARTAGPRRTAALVDALWRSGVEDVALHGQVLSLTVAQGDLKAICAAMGRLSGQYDVTIKTIAVSDGQAGLRCAATPAPAVALVNASFSTSPGATMLADLALPPAGPLTIDARGTATKDTAAAIKAIRAEADRQMIIIQAIHLGQGEATVYYSNTHYFSELEAVKRLTRILMAEAPSDIEKFRLIATLGGVPQREFDLLRGPLERSIVQTGDPDIAGNLAPSSAPMHNPILVAEERRTYPHFSWSVFPQMRQEFFDPDNPVGLQLLAGVTGTVELLPGLSLTGEAEANIVSNFNTHRPPDSALPHVRSDFLQYFSKGKNGIGDLEADYRFRLAPDVFAIARAGYLESMFMGVGGEVLWRPEGWRWALGADLYDVQQRQFNRLFGLRPYHVVTGHVSLYYASPWYGLNFVLRAGQYLAGDRGLTLEMTRRFSTGVEIGAFATKTNVSGAQFGEGSFDKGIIIRIPLDWVAPIETQGQLNMDIRPVQRDGGQRLMGDALLYEETRRTSQAAFEDATAIEDQ